jgi:hypothetical protein
MMQDSPREDENNEIDLEHGAGDLGRAIRRKSLETFFSPQVLNPKPISPGDGAC